MQSDLPYNAAQCNAVSPFSPLPHAKTSTPAFNSDLTSSVFAVFHQYCSRNLFISIHRQFQFLDSLRGIYNRTLHRHIQNRQRKTSRLKPKHIEPALLLSPVYSYPCTFNLSKFRRVVQAMAARLVLTFFPAQDFALCWQSRSQQADWIDFQSFQKKVLLRLQFCIGHFQRHPAIYLFQACLQHKLSSPFGDSFQQT